MSCLSGIRKKFYVPFLLVSVAFPAGAYAGDAFEARIEQNWRYSSDRSILMSEFWVPLSQNESSLIYADMRFMGDNLEAREFNWGFGYRDIVDWPVMGRGIVGVNAWYDRRITSNDSKFNQITTGLEWLDDQYDLRANVYWPLNKQQSFTQANPNGTNARFTGSQIVVNTDQLLVEEALPGWDLELGYKLDFLDKYTDATRVYLARYRFNGDRAEDVEGWRARFTSDISPNFQIGSRYQDDDIRGSQVYVEATIRFPFNKKKSYAREGLRARLDESPERDIDIVSNAAVLNDGMDVTLVNSDTRATQNIIHVDNTAAASGDGSAENPYNTLLDAQAVAGENDIVYVHRGDGTSTGMSNGYTLDDDGQKLIGSGVDLTLSDLGLSTFNGYGLSASSIVISKDKSGAPLVSNDAGNVFVMSADSNYLAGFDTGGSLVRVLHAQDATNFVVDTITSTTSCSNNCIRMNFNTDVTSSQTLRNITLNGNDNYSQLFVTSSNNADTTILLEDMTVTNSAVSALSLVAYDNSQVYFKLNRFSATASSGQRNISLNAVDSSVVKFMMQNSTLLNGSYGIYMGSSGAGVYSAMDLGGGSLGSVGMNQIYGATGAGIRLNMIGGIMSAQNNWWGDAFAPDSSDILVANGEYDADPHLTEAP